MSSTPSRRPGSIRRTSSIDTVRPDGITGRMVMHGSARDLLTTADGDDVVSSTAELHADVDGATRELRSISATPDVGSLRQLLGAVVGPGFRAKADGVAPEQRDQRTLLYLLLDDLPGASLVSGYALLRADAVPRATPDEYLGVREDMCAGWASDGAMVGLIRTHGQNPTPLGPPAPRLVPRDDPHAFHELPALPPHGMRRLRRIDVIAPSGPAEAHRVDVLFRDSHFDEVSVETVVHEYSVTATVDAASRTIVDIAATPDVLPWKECPAAVESATRLAGHPLADLRPYVRETFVGTTTCTHLNDVLRGLTDVEPLLDRLSEMPNEAAPRAR